MPTPERSDPEAIPPIVRILRAIGSRLLGIPRRLAWVPVIAWASLIFFFSSRPAPSFRGVGPFSGVFENFGHALEYGVFTVCLALLAPRRWDERGEWVDLGVRASAAIFLFVSLYAASDEWHQSFVPKRDASAFDVLTDVVGAASTLACIAAIGRRVDSGRALGIRFVLGLTACVVSATLATYGLPWT